MTVTRHTPNHTVILNSNIANQKRLGVECVLELSLSDRAGFITPSTRSPRNHIKRYDMHGPNTS